MTKDQELKRLAAEIAALGEQVSAKISRALEISRGREITRRDGRHFMVDGAHGYFGGAVLRVFLTGPLLKKDGSPHAKARESIILGSFVLPEE